MIILQSGSSSAGSDVVRGRNAARGMSKMGSKDELYIAAILSPYGISKSSTTSEFLLFHVDHATDAGERVA